LRYIKAIFFFLLAIAGILFGISNQGEAIVRIFWYTSKSYPLYLVLFACFVAGTLTAILYSYISGGDMSDQERRMNKQLDELKGKLKKSQASRSSVSLTESTGGSSGSTT